MINVSPFSHHIIIQRLEEDYLDEIVAIHRNVLGYTLNSQLGQQHLALLYSTMRKSPDCFVAVARSGLETVGFISGTLNPEAVKSRFLKSLSMTDWIKVAGRFLFHPRLILDFWSGTRIEQPVFWKGMQVIPTLTTIGIEERLQGSGIGKKLVKSLEEFFLQKGVLAYRLDTLQSNRKARDFYSRLGFTQVAERADSIVFIKSLDNVL